MGTEEWDGLAGPREQDEGATGVRTGSPWRQELRGANSKRQLIGAEPL